MSSGEVEQWRVIQTHPNYEVSDSGRVRRITSRTSGKAGHILKPCYRTNPGYLPHHISYLLVSLCGGGKIQNMSIHRLVAAAFLGDGAGREVNHKDGDGTNNRLDNLEYVDRSGNAQHAHDTGLQDCKGEMNGQARLTESQAEAILLSSRRRGQGPALAAKYGVSSTTIRDIWKERCWEHVAQRMRLEGRFPAETERADPNLIGMTFGRLTILSQVPPAPNPLPKRPRSRFLCLCSCGTQKEVERGPLVSGATRSCGCLNRETLIARNKAAARKP